ncbi:hypothetical protein Tco_0701080 [Tanacetum coccineum]
MRTASAAAKPCQGDSSEFYLITGSIYTDQRGTVVLPTIGAADSRRISLHLGQKGDISKANAQGDTTKKTDNAQNHSVTGMSTNEVQLKNSFSALGIITDDETDLELNNKGVDSVLNDSDSEEIKELILEGPNRNNTTITGASTPADTDWTANGSSCSKGTIINLGWNHNEVVAAVVVAFVSHYEQFLGLPGITSPFDMTDLFSARLIDDHASDMIRVISRHEVKDALFSMGNDKSPRSDVYMAAFFKESWEIIADDFFATVNEFFINGKLFKEMNHTIIGIIPKIRSPSRVTDYRPISCYNVLFKCISKIIANRIKESLKLLGFLKEVLVGFGFHARMIGWIMECVTTTSFSISINGSLHGFFKGKRGLRQGDPLSPYLFTLVMEIITLMLQRRVRESMVFKYHRYCGKLELINLCFVDDLFLFAHGDVDSAIMIKDALEEFKNVSGLTSSLPKSMAYFCNVLNHTKLSILNVLPFEEGQLPVKYLGVPLVSSRLIFRDCKELIERVQSRVQDWKKNRYRLLDGFNLLNQSLVLCIFIGRRFLFFHPGSCLILSNSCEVFFGAKDYLLRGNMSWGWRNILQLCPIIREFIKFKIGDGATASVWFDKWSEGDPLANTVSSRDIFCAGLDFSTKVRDVILHGAWNWPSYLCVKYLNLSMLAVPNIIENTPDRLVWQKVQGIDKPFSVTQVWSSLRPRNLKDLWFAVVWYSYFIPRHALTLWLIVKQWLKTQDRIYSWEASSSLSNLSSKANLENIVNHPPSAFAIFNTIITSLKALDEGYYSKNYVRKFLRALHPKWRAKAKKESNDEECSTSESEDKEYAMVVRDFKRRENALDAATQIILLENVQNHRKTRTKEHLSKVLGVIAGEEDDEESSSSGTKEIKFVKAQKKASPDGGPINMGGPLNVQAAPKENMRPPPGTTPGSEKSVF